MANPNQKQTQAELTNKPTPSGHQKMEAINIYLSDGTTLQDYLDDHESRITTLEP